MSARYIPDAGDLVWLTLDPTSGHEQRGRRPALVLTPRTYNDRTHLALCCSVTSSAKGYPFEVALDAATGVTGVVLADHVKSLDWLTRRAERISHVDDRTLHSVRTLLKVLLRAI